MKSWLNQCHEMESTNVYLATLPSAHRAYKQNTPHPSVVVSSSSSSAAGRGKGGKGLGKRGSRRLCGRPRTFYEEQSPPGQCAMLPRDCSAARPPLSLWRWSTWLLRSPISFRGHLPTSAFIDPSKRGEGEFSDVVASQMVVVVWVGAFSSHR